MRQRHITVVTGARIAGILATIAANVVHAEPPDPTSSTGLHHWLWDRPEEEEIGWTLRNDPKIRLSIGGALREQFEGYRNFELGTSPEELDGYHLHRLLVHADLRIEDTLRLFGEFGNSTVAGKENPVSPIDQDEAYINQAFVELSRYGSESGALRARLGRQEIGLGSGRLISTRGGPNIRRSFDAARLSYTSERLTLDLIYGAEVRIRPDNFDNRPDDAALLWGVYSTAREVLPGGNLDLYYLGVDREQSVYEAGVGPETRHSLGARLWGSAGAFDYNIEPVIQFGGFGERDICAWTIASDIGVVLGVSPMSPRLGLRANIISGGQSDRTLQTFSALFPNNSYFSEASIFAPSNLIDINPTLTLHPREDVALTFMWDLLWRYDTSDAIYGPPGVPLLPADATGARFIGHSISVGMEWRLSERLLLNGAYVHFEPGPAVTRAGGQSMDYVLLSLEWTF